jgi:hypothetical protein
MRSAQWSQRGQIKRVEGARTGVPYETLCPGNAKLQDLMEEYR